MRPRRPGCLEALTHGALRVPARVQMQAALCETPPSAATGAAGVAVDLARRGLLGAIPHPSDAAGGHAEAVAPESGLRTDAAGAGAGPADSCAQCRGNLDKAHQTIDELVRQIQTSAATARKEAEQAAATTARFQDKYKRAKEELILARKECSRLSRQQTEQAGSKQNGPHALSPSSSAAAMQQQLQAYEEQLRGYEHSLKQMRDENRFWLDCLLACVRSSDTLPQNSICILIAGGTPAPCGMNRKPKQQLCKSGKCKQRGTNRKMQISKASSCRRATHCLDSRRRLQPYKAGNHERRCLKRTIKTLRPGWSIRSQL